MATKTIKARLEISGDKDYREKLKKVNAELEQHKSTLGQLTKKYKENQNSQEVLSQKAEQMNTVFALQKEALDLTAGGLKNAQKEQERYVSQIDKLKHEIEAKRTALKQLNKTKDEAKEKQTKLNKEIKDYEAQLKEANKRNDEASRVVDEWAKKHDKAQKAY